MESEWTDHEAGFALARGKRVVPLKVDVAPYGFIGDFQALRLNQKMLSETRSTAMDSLKDHDTLGQKVRETQSWFSCRALHSRKHLRTQRN